MEGVGSMKAKKESKRSLKNSFQMFRRLLVKNE